MAVTTQENMKVISEAAANDAIIVDRSDLGMLKISGDTRLDLLDRMSTQAVKDLKSGEGAATILTSDIGRIVDRLILYTTSDNVYALTGENNAENIIRYLMRFVFFNDDFHMEDISAETAVLAVYGAQAAQRLSEAGFPEVDLPLHHWRKAQIGAITAYLHRTDPVAGDGYFVTADTGAKEPLWQHLTGSGLIPTGTDAFEALRIESGLPRFGRELTPDYIPLETGLWDDVSFHKGCYIGQEIIARMESRGRIAKKLVRLSLAAPVEAGAEISAAGRKVGAISSAAAGANGPVALGYVKTAALEKESTLTAGEVVVTAVEPVPGHQK